jgi:threonine/homoserine/homoserine lactone efflux protein
MEHLWLYALLVFGIIALPGLDTAFVLASSLASGREAGFAAIAGLVLGGFAHVFLSAFGIGLLLQHVPALFNVMLTAGGLYVAWMGYSLWRGASAVGEIESIQTRAMGVTFGRAVLTCLLNPKAYIFMLAVFPQFIKPECGALWLQALILFGIGAICQMLVYGTVVVAAAKARNWIRTSSGSQIIFGRSVALLLLFTAAWTLWTGWQFR